MDISIRGFLEDHVLFKDYASNSKFIDTLASQMKTRVFSDGAYVIRKGEVGRAMFFVLRGEVEVISDDGETIINMLKEQSFFGEIGLLFSIPRTVSCRARGRSILLTLTKESLENAVSPYPRIAQSIAQIAEERFASHIKHVESAVNVEFGEELKLGMTQNDLKTIPLFRDCEIGFLHNLAMSLKPVQYRNGEIIIRKGDMASEMYFVVRGVVQVYDECTEQVFAQFQPGSFFGEVGLFFKIKRSATVRCHSPVVTVFKLLKSDLDTILTNYPEVRQKIEAEAAQRYKYIEARENANIDTDQHISTDIEVVRERLKTIPLFKDTSTAFLHQLALAAKLVVVNQGDVIIRKGEIGRNMYFVIDGAVQVVSEDLQTVYAEMAKLSFFGEVSMFYEVNRTATVRASARSTLVDLSKEALESVLAQYTTIRTQVQAKAVENYKLYLKRQRALEGMGKGSGQSEQFDIEATTNRLKKMSIFQHCQEGFLKVLALSTSIRSLRRGELVIRRGDPSLEMFFIVKGSVEIISNDGSSVYDVVSDGDFFGEVGVIRNVNRTAAVRVSSDSCDFIVLSADAMRTALGEYPDSFQVVLIEAQKRFQLAEERTLRGEHALIHNRDGSTTDLAPSTSEASLSRQPTAKRAVTIKPSALQRPLTDASNSERESDSRSPSKQASACVSPTSPTADKGKQQAQQQQQPALLDQINTEELQRNTEKEKTSRSFGQLFSRHAPRKKREELESSHLKKNAMSVSQDSVVDPEPKRGMSMHVPASATGAALTQEPQAVGTPASSMSSGRESIVGSSNTSLATSTGKDREGSQTQVQKALGKMLQTIKNSLQRKESPKVAPVPIKESVSTTSSMSDSAKLNTLMSVVREDVLRRLYSPPHAPVQSILDADEHQLSVILARVPPLDILRLRGVCRRWNELLLLPQFWSKLNLKPEFRKINRRAIEVLGYLGGDHLVRIDLAGCWMVYDEDLGSLASQCPNIKTLSVSNCWKLTDLGLSFVAEHCTKLLNLNISYCGQMTGTGFAEHQWRALRRINLSYCKQLGDEHLERLLSRTTDLQDIKMRRCQRISDFGIFLIVRYCRRLRSLDLRDSDQISDRCLKWIASSCYNLIDLNLAFCTRITNAGLYDLSLGSQNFQRLDFSHCSQLTDAALIFFSDSIRSLRSISLRHCRKMTDSVTAYLAKTAPRLRFVDITGCPNMTIVSRMQLEAGVLVPGGSGYVQVRMDKSPESRGVKTPGTQGKPKAVELMLRDVFSSGPREMMHQMRSKRRHGSGSSPAGEKFPSAPVGAGGSTGSTVKRSSTVSSEGSEQTAVASSGAGSSGRPSGGRRRANSRSGTNME